MNMSRATKVTAAEWWHNLPIEDAIFTAGPTATSHAVKFYITNPAKTDEVAEVAKDFQPVCVSRAMASTKRMFHTVYCLSSCLHDVLPFGLINESNNNNNGLFVRPWKAHHTKHRRPPREGLFLSATLRFNSMLQCGRCLLYLHPHNPDDEM